MKKAYNFNAGPCVLPKPAIEAAIEALKDFPTDTASSSSAAVHPSSSSMSP